MTTRTIANIELATNERVGSFSIKNVFPTRNLKQVDPFLLVHHMPSTELKPGAETRIPPHPHAGFDVMTYLLEGEFFHRDSQGHDQVAGPGDINWMSAGAGIVHSEGPTEQMLQKGGRVQLLQIWINLPADKKHGAPAFHHYGSASLPVLNNEGFSLKVVLGKFGDYTSPVVTQTPMFLYHLQVRKGQAVTLPVDPLHTSAIYIMKGSLQVLNTKPVAGELVNFELNGDQVSFTATDDTELLLLGGAPIKEKVVSYGPFVMNSLEEVQGAISDYENGRMGSLSY